MAKMLYLVVYGDSEPDRNGILDLGRVAVFDDWREAVRALVSHIERHPDLYQRCRDGAATDQLDHDLEVLRNWMRDGVMSPRAREFRGRCEPIRIVPLKAGVPTYLSEHVHMPHTRSEEQETFSVDGRRMAVCVGGVLCDVRDDAMVADASRGSVGAYAKQGITRDDVLAGALIARVSPMRYGVAVRGEHVAYTQSLEEGLQVVDEEASGIPVYLNEGNGVSLIR